MQTTFTTETGTTIAPEYFAVYTLKNGSSFKKIQSELDAYNFSEYEDIIKIDLFKNGTENLSPERIDTIYNKP